MQMAGKATARCLEVLLGDLRQSALICVEILDARILKNGTQMTADGTQIYAD
jgi:hypothetical protein